jgi:tripartite-type tricarboxylate transporter receptor subunit TctC
MNRREFWKGAVASSVAVGSLPFDRKVLAQDAYPNRLVKILIPYPPGGLPDTIARIVARRMEAIWKQPLVVENRAGASGGLAVQTLLSAPADGHTLLVTEGSILYNSLIITKLSYDWRELVPAAQVARAPQFLAVHPKVPATSLQEFIAYARSAPGKISYGSAGIGSPHHLAMEAVKAALKLDMLHIPFKGAGEATPALVGGHIDALWAAYPSIAGFAKDGSLRLLAINSPVRSELAPDVPPMADVIAGFDTASIIGFFARSGTPNGVIERLSQVAIEATQDAEVKQKLFVVGVEAAGLNGPDYSAALNRERERVGKLVKEAKIQVD